MWALGLICPYGSHKAAMASLLALVALSASSMYGAPGYMVDAIYLICSKYVHMRSPNMPFEYWYI